MPLQYSFIQFPAFFQIVDKLTEIKHTAPNAVTM
ncbi:MAG: hypothetical protein PWQ88_909 [Candidatus Methanomethylophilaceae archaeon]|nr:hypothetical protein [Candidatus Methanomethylophilaceae archaeon]MDI3541963.1 hypothetical protein [Candidatus Methanomethylophilaceae archaeon]